MEGVFVCGSFVSFDCDDVNLGDLKASEAQLQPFLLSFSRGLFTRVKRLNLVPQQLCPRRVCSFASFVLQRDNEIGDAGVQLLAQGLRGSSSSVQELRLVPLPPLARACGGCAR